MNSCFASIAPLYSSPPPLFLGKDNLEGGNKKKKKFKKSQATLRTSKEKRNLFKHNQMCSGKQSFHSRQAITKHFFFFLNNHCYKKIEETTGNHVSKSKEVDSETISFSESTVIK